MTDKSIYRAAAMGQRRELALALLLLTGLTLCNHNKAFAQEDEQGKVLSISVASQEQFEKLSYGLSHSSFESVEVTIAPGAINITSPAILRFGETIKELVIRGTKDSSTLACFDASNDGKRA